MDQIGKIVSDPGEFASTLIEGFVSAFNNFKDNFTEHLENGVQEYLFGEIDIEDPLDDIGIDEIKEYLMEIIIGEAIPFVLGKLAVSAGIPLVGWVKAAIDGLQLAYDIFIEKSEQVKSLVESLSRISHKYFDKG